MKYRRLSFVMKLDDEFLDATGPIPDFLKEEIQRCVDGLVGKLRKEAKERGVKPSEELSRQLAEKYPFDAPKAYTENARLWIAPEPERDPTEVTDEVLAGIDFLFTIAEGDDHVCYAAEEDQKALKAAGEWFRATKERRE